MSLMGPYLKMMRPHQWVKNGFVFAALVFSKSLYDPVEDLRVFLGFILFCLAAGAVYICNDVLDLQSDRVHPEKRHRPLAAGVVGLRPTLLVMVALFLVAIPCSFLLNVGFGVTVLSYAGLNLLYSRLLKRIVIVDVIVIAFGFVLRAVGGAFIIHVAPSHWLLVCTFTLCLFLGFVKRRSEIVVLGDDKADHREVLGEYSVRFLDEMMVISAVLAVGSYGLYTMSPETVARFETHKLIYTSVFVLYGIYRLLYLVHFQQKGGDAARVLLTDKPLLISMILWLLTVCVIIYSSGFRHLTAHLLEGTQ